MYLSPLAFRSAEPVSSITGSFAAWRNAYRGPVLLLASGPSAGRLNLPLWRDIPIITMNGAVAKLVGSTLRPLFYVCSDLSFAQQQPDLYRQGLELATRLALWPQAIQALPPELAAKAHPLHRAPATRLEHHLGAEQELAQRLPTLFSRRARDIGFSCNLDYGIFDVRTVAFIALQLAYHLGFGEIYLAGVDLDGERSRFYEDGRSPASPCGLDEHLHSRILPGLQVMQTAMRAADRQVFNLSTCSRIPGDLIPLADLATVETRWLWRRRRQPG